MLGDIEQGRQHLRQMLAFDDLAQFPRLRVEELRAEAQFLAFQGQFENALTVLVEGVRLTELVQFSKSPVMRLRAQLLAKQGASSEETETIYRDIIEWDRCLGNKFDELEGTTLFAHWLQSQGRSVEARTILSQVYNWFTEGFEVLALQEAKALLDELNN
jgi:hypothetical protein